MGTFLKNKISNKVNLVYVSTFIFLSLIFLRILHGYIEKSFFEQDLFWFIPSVIGSVKGLSFGRLLAYFLNPFPLRDSMPVLKVYIYSVLSLFGPFARYFMNVSLIFHFACSILLFFLGKNLGLNSRISFLSGLIFLTLFAHFHAYMWPMAFMHVATIFFIFLVLIFYLKTDKLIVHNQRFGRFYIPTLVINFFAPLCRLSILSLPVMVLAHILFCSKDNAERIKKYKIWMPLFATYLIYPLFLISSGEFRFQALIEPFLAKCGPHFRDLLSHSFFVKVNSGMGFFVLFLAGLFLLYAFKAVLVFYSNLSYRAKRLLKSVFIITAAFLLAALIIQGWPQRLFIPYNIFAPFIGIVSSFLNPLDNAMLVDPARSNYSVPLQLNILSLFISFFILYLFVRKFLFKQKQLIILIVFYLFSLAYIYLWRSVPSRYFIYISPSFCIIFSCVFDYVFSYFMNQAKVKSAVKEMILCLIFIALCLPNLLAIKLSLFRGKLANNFLAYDYIRAANLIKDDLAKDKKEAIYINGILPMTFPEVENPVVTVASDLNNDNPRFIFMQVFNDASLDIKFNQGTLKGKGRVYFLDSYLIKNDKGIDIGLFRNLFKEGRVQLGSGRYKEAEESFKAASRIRPFLFNYILPGFKLKELRWITGCVDARTWLNKMEGFYSLDYDAVTLKRNRQIISILNKEVDDYIRCLFFISFLKYASGDLKASGEWFMKISFLDSDFNRVRSRLMEDSLTNSDKGLSVFLGSLDSSSLYIKLDDYRDRYIFEKFIYRLVFKKI